MQFLVKSKSTKVFCLPQDLNLPLSKQESGALLPNHIFKKIVALNVQPFFGERLSFRVVLIPSSYLVFMNAISEFNRIQYFQVFFVIYECHIRLC